MKIAIFSRAGACFPNIVSQGLATMLDDLGVENKIFYDSIPMLMRLLPLCKKPKRWHNNLQFRIRNKIANYSKDRILLREINEYDAVIISECYANAFWKNYFAIEEFKERYKGIIISYTESPLDAAPLNKIKYLDNEDYDESIYDFNLFVTDIMETKGKLNSKQTVIGINIANNTLLRPCKKEEFTAVVDFSQSGYELYREQQIRILKKLGVKTILLEGKYPIDEIRKIYQQASIFFISFPETFGLPIAECLSCGAFVFSPNHSWPMAWRLDEAPMPFGGGILPNCFQIYGSDADLESKLYQLKNNYDVAKTSFNVFECFIEHYDIFYHGHKENLKYILRQL